MNKKKMKQDNNDRAMLTIFFHFLLNQLATVSTKFIRFVSTFWLVAK